MGKRATAAPRGWLPLEHIDTCFCEPDFNAPALATKLGISPRYLHRLLERSGLSFTARVNELRLQRAHKLLAEQCSSKRVSDIALVAGFSDVSYFNRLFRARFGDTPREVRRRGVRQDDRE
ncbi:MULTISPECIES: helix-turn-helix domain-containing protein [Bradyrhizobium]|uniref:helix-turn-helix domain-containing protein n=1 Tax=Bradyrhizobium TaxID=374 RepID=UPI0024C01C3D|nr:helix-turn-helix domain-containing protein [Bradyrhizobium vignae]